MKSQIQFKLAFLIIYLLKVTHFTWSHTCITRVGYPAILSSFFRFGRSYFYWEVELFPVPFRDESILGRCGCVWFVGMCKLPLLSCLDS